MEEKNILNVFEDNIFAIKVAGDNGTEQTSSTSLKLQVRKQTQEMECPLDLATWIKILITKQMLQRLPIAPAEVKAGNISENLLN